MAGRAGLDGLGRRGGVMGLRHGEVDTAFDRAALCLLDLGFHRALGQERGAYVEALPHPRWDVALAGEGYDRLILVDPRVPRELALKHGNVAHHMPQATIVDVIPDLPRHEPYWLQVQAGDRYRGQAVRDAVASFGPGERGLTVSEGIALVLQHPDVTAGDCGIDLPGSRAQGYGVPCIAVWYGKVGLFGRPETVPSPLYGAATARAAGLGAGGGGRR